MTDYSYEPLMADYSYEPLLSEDGARGICIFPSDDDCSTESMDSLYRLYGIMPLQTHSLNVGVVNDRDDIFPDTDALISFKKELPVGVRTADCVPVLVYAPDVRGVAAIHAGWKGSLGGIVDKTLDTFEGYGASPEKMIVAFGPSISQKMYEVDHDLARRFKEAGFGNNVSYPDGEEGKPHIDLQGVNVARLLRHGVKMENIIMHPGCTYSTQGPDGSPLYQSHRRSKGKPGRNFTCISLI